MSDKDKQRFYWLKLKKGFFQQHQMKVLKAIPNGRLYALIYLELLDESVTHNGELRFSELLPYDSVTLAAVIDEDKDNLEKAIQTFIDLELVEVLDDKTIYMKKLNEMVGSESGQTIRKREARLVNSTKQLPNNYQENTLDIRDKNIDSRNKSKEIIDDDKYKELQKWFDVENLRFKEVGYSSGRIADTQNVINSAILTVGYIPSPDLVHRLRNILIDDEQSDVWNKEGYVIQSLINEKKGRL